MEHVCHSLYGEPTLRSCTRPVLPPTSLISKPKRPPSTTNTNILCKKGGESSLRCTKKVGQVVKGGKQTAGLVKQADHWATTLYQKTNINVDHPCGSSALCELAAALGSVQKTWPVSTVKSKKNRLKVLRNSLVLATDWLLKFVLLTQSQFLCFNSERQEMLISYNKSKNRLNYCVWPWNIYLKQEQGSCHVGPRQHE